MKELIVNEEFPDPELNFNLVVTDESEEEVVSLHKNMKEIVYFNIHFRMILQVQQLLSAVKLQQTLRLEGVKDRSVVKRKNYLKISNPYTNLGEYTLIC